MTQPRYARWWVLCAALTAATGLALSYPRLPAAWLLAGMISAAVVATISRTELRPDRILVNPAQGVVAILATLPLTRLDLATVAPHLVWAAVATVATMAICALAALIVATLSREVSTLTAQLAMLAGGAATVSTLADEFGADKRYVSLTQYLRLVAVTLSLPIVVQLLGASTTAPSSGPATTWTWPGLAVAALIIATAGPLGARLGVPAPYLLTVLLVALVVGLAAGPYLDLGLPDVVAYAAYVVIGWQAGGSFSQSALAELGRLLPLTLAAIAVSVVACFGVGVALAYATGLSLADAYLATSPGGIFTVLAIAHDIDADPAVVTMQVVRMLVVIVAAILLAHALRRRFRS